MAMRVLPRRARLLDVAGEPFYTPHICGLVAIANAMPGRPAVGARTLTGSIDQTFCLSIDVLRLGNDVRVGIYSCFEQCDFRAIERCVFEIFTFAARDVLGTVSRGRCTYVKIKSLGGVII